jgi:hypothetical protein
MMTTGVVTDVVVDVRLVRVAMMNRPAGMMRGLLIYEKGMHRLLFRGNLLCRRECLCVHRARMQIDELEIWKLCLFDRGRGGWHRLNRIRFSETNIGMVRMHSDDNDADKEGDTKHHAAQHVGTPCLFSIYGSFCPRVKREEQLPSRITSVIDFTFTTSRGEL